MEYIHTYIHTMSLFELHTIIFTFSTLQADKAITTLICNAFRPIMTQMYQNLPGSFIGTTISDLLKCLDPEPVLASKQIQSACT